VAVLLSRIEAALGAGETVFRLHLDSSDGAGVAWAYAHGRVTGRRDRGDGVWISVSVDPQNIERFLARYGDNITVEQPVRRAS
jgi:hypothetical protein